MTDLSMLDALDGLVTPDVGRVLYGLACEIPGDQAIVELGSYRGKSTAYLAAGARDGYQPPVYAVDAWKPDVTAPRWSPVATVGEFEAQLMAVGLRSGVTALRGMTAEVMARYGGPPVGLLFVDADHSERGVLADVRAWRPRVAADGYVVLDDYRTPRNPGVEAAVERLLAEGTLKRLRRVAAGRLAICGLE